MAMHAAQQPGGLDRWRLAQPERRARDRLSIPTARISDWLCTLAAFIALFRGTQMWFGYPSAQSEFDLVSPLTMQLFIYALMPMIGLYFVLNAQQVVRRVRAMSVLLLVSLLFISLSVVASADLVSSARGVMAVFAISMPILFYSWRFGAVRMMALLRTFALVAVVANVLYAALFPKYGFMSGSLAGSLRGLFQHKNLFGHSMALYFVLLLPSPAERPWLRYPVVLRTLGAVAALGCIVASRSSMALVETIIGCGCLWFASSVNLVPTRTVRSNAVIIALLAAVALIYFGGLMIASSVAQGVGKDLTFSGRTQVWAALAPHILDYPFTGHGFAMFRSNAYLASFAQSVTWGVRSTHNTYIELLLNIGIPGALTWFCFVLGRVFGKFANAPRDRTERMVKNREIAVMLMILFGALTEAGSMLAPLSMWPVLLALLPKDDPPVPVRAAAA